MTVGSSEGRRVFKDAGLHRRMLGIIVLLIAINPALTGYSRSQPAIEIKSNGLSKGMPEFDETTPTEIYASPGQPVFLPCSVRHLGDKLVSWIRTVDLHILTNGKHTFTGDSRFDVIPSSDGRVWSLRIKFAKITDSGRYECQVNTDPKINRFFTLVVKEAPLRDSPSPPEVISPAVKASISGPKEQYAREGYTVTFECRLTIGDQRPRTLGLTVPTVQWLHNGYAVSFQSERGGISIETERGQRHGVSRLTVASVAPQDAGKYSCSGDGVASDSVYLVIEGEHSEAMQRDQESSSAAAPHRGILKIFKIPWIQLGFACLCIANILA